MSFCVNRPAEIFSRFTKSTFVRQFFGIIIFFVSHFLFYLEADAQGLQSTNQESPKASQLAVSTMELSQDVVLQRAFLTSDQAIQIDLQFQQNQISIAQIESLYDWKLSAEGGYQYDKSASFSPTSYLGSKYERTKGSVNLQKSLMTGTLLGLELNYFGQKYDSSGVSSSYSTSSILSSQTQGNFGLTFEQPLWANQFGSADRSLLESARATFKANDISKIVQLQDLGLMALKTFWDTYVASQQLKEALASREKFSQLVLAVRKKSNLGYSNPGELPQALAQYEVQNQNVEKSQLDFESKLRNLKTLLKIDSETQIVLKVQQVVKPFSELKKIDVQNLRAYKVQKLKLQSAELSYENARSTDLPKLSLVGKAYTSGWSDSTTDDTFTMMTAGRQPSYYMGLKLSYTFGSDYYQSDIKSKLASQELERSKLMLLERQTNDSVEQALKKIKMAYEVLSSADKQKKYFNQALVELNKTYLQGRTDIKNLVDMMNNNFLAEYTYERSLGDFFVAQGEYLALTDQLFKNDNLK